MKYNPLELEKKWQQYWEEEDLFKVDLDLPRKNITSWKCSPIRQETFI